ncbi:hypothetical protein, partial [Roseiarcus sp.]|uniref:hypothetical protein n=1 Tax=Roseiarcus sp. TaxID=1969460 RepID=UPI003F9A8F2A
MTTMTSQDHKFNDDLLLLESDLSLARKKYPSIVHVLDHPALRRLFIEYDEPARRAKSKGLWFGLLAILLGLIALAVAALESKVTASDLGDCLSVSLALVSSVCAGVSVLIGN